jgi:hypothetical protein
MPRHFIENHVTPPCFEFACNTYLRNELFTDLACGL